MYLNRSFSCMLSWQVALSSLQRASAWPRSFLSVALRYFWPALRPDVSQPTISADTVESDPKRTYLRVLDARDDKADWLGGAPRSAHRSGKGGRQGTAHVGNASRSDALPK